jgi:hypothetical protein
VLIADEPVSSASHVDEPPELFKRALDRLQAVQKSQHMAGRSQPFFRPIRSEEGDDLAAAAPSLPVLPQRIVFFTEHFFG